MCPTACRNGAGGCTKCCLTAEDNPGFLHQTQAWDTFVLDSDFEVNMGKRVVRKPVFRFVMAALSVMKKLSTYFDRTQA